MSSSHREHQDLYDYPQYYDLVFGSDWRAEYHFLRSCFERYGQRPVQRIFEPACGTGRLMFRLAKAGFEVSGLDLNRRAVEYCNRRLRKHGLPESAWVGDMSDFRLPRKVDAAFNMINSFRHLTSERAARAHLACVASGLKKGGLYFLGLHLTPTAAEPIEEESWSARRGHLCVNTRMWTLERDMRRREERFGMTFDVYTPTGHQQLKDEVVFRTYTAAQLRRLLKSVPELELLAIHDFSYEVHETVTLGPETEDVVLVLGRRS